MQIIQLALRAFQFLMTLLIMALIGNVIADAFAGNPSIINYVIFVSVFAMLSLFYLIAAAIMDGFAIPLAMVVLDALNTLLFLVGGIALAAYLGVHSCGNTSYVIHNKITNGSYNPKKRCHEEQAACAFLWFGFAAWAGSLILSALSSRGGTSGLRRVDFVLQYLTFKTPKTIQYIHQNRFEAAPKLKERGGSEFTVEKPKVRWGLPLVNRSPLLFLPAFAENSKVYQWTPDDGQDLVKYQVSQLSSAMFSEENPWSESNSVTWTLPTTQIIGLFEFISRTSTYPISEDWIRVLIYLSARED
ncbi:MAG: hypothetical protein Q9225_002825 [Loekoesia sp. 1 TL-2023]